MLDDAFPYFERQFESGKIQIALFELFHNPQRLQVMVEAVTRGTQQVIKLSRTCMSEGRVPNVVDESQGLSEVGIESERFGNGPGDLRYFDRVREAIAEVIGIAAW